MKDLVFFTKSSVSLSAIREPFSDADYFASLNEGNESNESEVHIASRGADESILKIRDIPVMVESYQKDDLSLVLSHIPLYKTFLCNYRDVEFAKEVMLVIIRTAECVVIDNDHDGLMTGEEFAEKVRKDPNWDRTK